jgi:hypothetical protein
MRRPLKPLGFDIKTLMPDDTPLYMVDAWVGAISWSTGVPEIFNAFLSDTNVIYRVPTNMIDVMIDEATGAGVQFLTEYIKWFNVNVWGPIDGGV